MSQEVLLYTQNLQEANQEIKSFGGRVTQQLTNVVIVVTLPDSVDAQSLTKSSTVAPPDLDQVSQIAANAWMNLQNKRELRAPSPAEGLPWDTPGYQPPRKMQGEMRSLSNDVAESTGTPTSLYMIGSIAVGVIIVSGPQPNQPNQPDLSVSDAERQKVIQEVQEGLSFLANAESRANISFVYDIRFIDVTATPGSTGDYESAEAPWRNAALRQMGFAASRQGSIDYVQQLRQDRGTDWAYVAYLTKYPLHHFAYAVDEKLCMEYANDGWGSDLINSVFAHETCHVFGAADEYGSCACGGSHGHLGVPNNNCVNCTGTHIACLMDANVLSLCQWTRGQIGWDDCLFDPDPHHKWRYNAVWNRDPAVQRTSIWVAGWALEHFDGKNNELLGQGYYLTDLQAVDIGGGNWRYNAVWNRDPAAQRTSIWVAGWALEHFEGKNNELLGQGYYLTDLQAVDIDGGNWRYNAVWNRDPAAQRTSIWVAGWALEHFDGKNNELLGQGYYLTDLQAVDIGGGNWRYNAVWNRDPAAQRTSIWVAGWALEHFDGKNNELLGQGYYLTDLQAVDIGGGNWRYNAVWNRDPAAQRTSIWVAGWALEHFDGKNNELLGQGYYLTSLEVYNLV